MWKTEVFFRKRWIVLVLILVGTGLYASSLNYPFIWDDEGQILGNEVIQNLSPENIIHAFKGSTFSTDGGIKADGDYYKPLMTLAYTVVWAIFGNQPFYFHLIQLTLFIANAILIFSLFSFFFSRNIAFLLALVFLVHPLNSEVALYIANYQDAMFMFFGMLALNIYCWQDKLKHLSGYRGMFLAASFLLLSVLSKETGALFFPISFTFIYFYRRSELKRYLIPCVLMGIEYLSLRFGVADISLKSGMVAPISRADFIERLLTLPSILLFYFKHFFMPWPLAMGRHWVVQSFSLEKFFMPLAIVLMFFSLLYLLWKRNKNNHMIFFLTILGFGLSIHLHFIPLDFTAADRWFYLPGVGMLGLLGIYLENHGITLGKYTQWGPAVLLVGAFSFLTFNRSTHWKDAMSLYLSDIRHYPGSYDLMNNLGVEFYRKGDREQGCRYFQNSVTQAPHWFTNWGNLGVCLEDKGLLILADEAFSRAMENKRTAKGYADKIRILHKLGDNTQAKSLLYLEALKFYPRSSALLGLKKMVGPPGNLGSDQIIKQGP